MLLQTGSICRDECGCPYYCLLQSFVHFIEYVPLALMKWIIDPGIPEVAYIWHTGNAMQYFYYDKDGPRHPCREHNIRLFVPYHFETGDHGIWNPGTGKVGKITYVMDDILDPVDHA